MKALIATVMKPNTDEAFAALCQSIRSSAEEHGLLKVKGGIYIVPGPGCWNWAFELEGEEKEAERFVNQLVNMLEPAKWSWTDDAIPEVDTWIKE